MHDGVEENTGTFPGGTPLSQPSPRRPLERSQVTVGNGLTYLLLDRKRLLVSQEGSAFREMLFRQSKNLLFEESALPHLDAVYRFAMHLAGNESDAADLTQECFHQAYRKFHQFQRGTHCKAWLFRITRNAHIDRLRRRAREPRLSELQEETSGGVRDESPTTALNWSELAARGEGALLDLFGDEVSRSLGELPVEFRLAVILCDVEGFSYDEISQILGCPVGTVRSRIFRSRSFLKEKLFEHARSMGFARERPEKVSGLPDDIAKT